MKQSFAFHVWFSQSSTKTIDVKPYNDVIMGTMASQITSLTTVYSTVYSVADQRKHQSSASLARRPVNSPHKCPVPRKMFPFDDVIMKSLLQIKLLQILRPDYEVKYKHMRQHKNRNYCPCSETFSRKEPIVNNFLRSQKQYLSDSRYISDHCYRTIEYWIKYQGVRMTSMERACSSLKQINAKPLSIWCQNL